MSNRNQGSEASETREISVDLNAADPDKAVTRRAASDIARNAREEQDDRPRTKAEKELFKRMGRLERNLTKQFDQKMAEREAEWQRERSELIAKSGRAGADRDAGPDAADAAHEAAINKLKADLEAAYEKGDSRASADITLQISKLDAQFWAKKAHQAGVGTRETADPAAGAPRAAAAPRSQGPTRAGSRFITANEDWWEDPEFKIEQAAANAIYLDLVNNEGFDAKSDETFREVAKQLKAKFPKLAVHPGRRGPDDDEGDEDDEGARGGEGEGAERQPRRAPAYHMEDRGAAGDRQRGGGDRRTLTAAEMKTMRDCRLDPDNDRDVVQFLREAVALERASA